MGPDWRKYMPLTREVAGECARDGQLEILQKGKQVDPDSYKGPIRLRLVQVLGDETEGTVPNKYEQC